MVSLPKHAAATDCIDKSGTFTISVLSFHQSSIARQFGGKMQFDQREIEPGNLNFTQWKVPVITDACAQVLCNVQHSLNIREQVVVVAEMINIVSRDQALPLEYDHSDFFAI